MFKSLNKPYIYLTICFFAGSVFNFLSAEDKERIQNAKQQLHQSSNISVSSMNEGNPPSTEAEIPSALKPEAKRISFTIGSTSKESKVTVQEKNQEEKSLPKTFNPNAGFQPFLKNPAKQKRYENYIKKKQGTLEKKRLKITVFNILGSRFSVRF